MAEDKEDCLFMPVKVRLPAQLREDAVGADHLESLVDFLIPHLLKEASEEGPHSKLPAKPIPPARFVPAEGSSPQVPFLKGFDQGLSSESSTEKAIEQATACRRLGLPGGIPHR